MKDDLESAKGVLLSVAVGCTVWLLVYLMVRAVA